MRGKSTFSLSCVIFRHGRRLSNNRGPRAPFVSCSSDGCFRGNILPKSAIQNPPGQVRRAAEASFDLDMLVGEFLGTRQTGAHGVLFFRLCSRGGSRSVLSGQVLHFLRPDFQRAVPFAQTLEPFCHQPWQKECQLFRFSRPERHFKTSKFHPLFYSWYFFSPVLL